MGRTVARWGQDTPLSRETVERLFQEIGSAYGLENVRLAVLVRSGAIEKTIDNENDGRETLRRIAESKERKKKS